MELSTSNISALITAIDMRLQEVWDKFPSFMDRIGTTLPCNSSQLVVPWLQTFPQLRRFVGDRKYQNYIANAFTFTPELWELTAELDRAAIEDDQWGVWLSMAPSRISRECKVQPDKLISELIEQQANTFDGVSFFSSAHPVDFSDAASATQSNQLVSSALSANNVQVLRAQMMELKLPDGLPSGFVPDTIMVPPALELIALQIAHSVFYPDLTGGVGGVGPVSNVMKGAYQVVVNPYLTSSTRWYLLCSTAGVSPLLWIERVAPQISYQVNPEDFSVFNRDKFAIGVRRRAVAGLGLYYLMGCGTSDSSIPVINPGDLAIQ